MTAKDIADWERVSVSTVHRWAARYSWRFMPYPQKPRFYEFEDYRATKFRDLRSGRIRMDRPSKSIEER